MPNPTPKKHFQIQRLFGLAKPKAELADIDTHEYLADLAHGVTLGRTSSLKEITFEEANDMIEALGGVKFSLFKSRRTENYHRQQAGIKTIVTAAHLEKMTELWFAYPHRTEAGLIAICQRTIKVDHPRTAEECNKIVEAIKSMNKREADAVSTESGSDRGLVAPQPKFRRIA